MTGNISSFAKQLSGSERKEIAMQALRRNQEITQIAKTNQVSRNFIYAQKSKALQGIDAIFGSVKDSDVLFYLPITKGWIVGFVLCLLLHCRGCYRGIAKTLDDAFDISISIATIHNIVQTAAKTAQTQNTQQDLSGIAIASHDELFHNNKPILTGVDNHSLYCHLLSKEDRRDGDTWAINLLDLQKQNFDPDRVIADDGSGLHAGHNLVLSDTPCDADHFHIIKDLVEMLRYFKNKLKSSITQRIYFENKLLSKNPDYYVEQLSAARKEEEEMQHLVLNISILVSWMWHDILNKAGANITVRQELFNFILTELESLARLHPHRIQSVCTKLKNQRDSLLAFVNVLEGKFIAIAEQHQCSLDIVWSICKLQRCEYYSDNYIVRSEPVFLQLGEEAFEAIEDAVIEALDSTECTSCMVENLNSRVSPYLFIRKTSDQNHLDLLRFYFNHTPFLRSGRARRVNKTPTELLTGKTHASWLELLGYSRFKKAA